MELRPAVNAFLTINNQNYAFTEHPAAKGMPYGQSGRRATVYQMRAPDGSLHAFKIFTMSYREPRVAEGVQRLAPYANLPGLQVCRRFALTPQNHADLLGQYDNLGYAVLMPWVYGENWQEFILSGKSLTTLQSRSLARSFAGILASMETQGLAHCDISGPNVLLPGMQSSSDPGKRGEGVTSLVALVDVEDMYAPGFPRPQALAGGSSGYAHRTANQGVWAADGDRFSGATLLAEMLGWSDETVRKLAYGEQYFDLKEMQQNSERYQVLRNSLLKNHGSQIADIFGRAWESPNCNACPKFAEWVQALGESDGNNEKAIQTGGSTMTMGAPPPPPPKKETPQERLVSSAVERAQIYLSVGQTDKALRELEEAYRMAPAIGGRELAKVLLRIAEGKERTGDLQGALTDYQRALSIAPPGGMRDELATIVAEVNHKIELARGAMVAPVYAPPPPKPVYIPPPEPVKKRDWVGWALLGLGLLAVVGCVIGLIIFWPQINSQNTNVTNPVVNIPVSTFTPMIQQSPTQSQPLATNPPALPGKVTVSVEKFAKSIPWLEYDPTKAPSSRIIVFNTRLSPFDQALLRKAFASAIHRQGVADFAKQLYGYEESIPLTTFTPPAIMGRDLYREIGIRYDLDQARQYLSQAGYPRGVGLPPVVLSFLSLSGPCDDPTSPAIQLTQYLVDMWTQVGINVTVDCYIDDQEFTNKRNSGALQLFIYGWSADYNDPDDFLKGVFYSSSEANPGFFADAQFDQLVNKAASLTDPIERQRLYIQAEKVLTEEQAAIIPLFAYTADLTESDSPTTTPPTTENQYSYTDDFSTKKWDEGNVDKESWGYDGEAYFVKAFTSGIYRWIVPPVDFQPQAMQFDAWIADESKNNPVFGYYGVMCRKQDDKNFYIVDIDPSTPGYQIHVSKDGEYKKIADFTKISNFDSTGTNKILLDCTGDSITLFINDTNIVSINDNTLPVDGDMAILVGNWDPADPKGFKVMFDNFYAYRHVQ